jgi:hypothetical protein
MAINPGILPLSLVRGVAFVPVILQCKDQNVLVTGTLSPNAAGTYVPSGNFNGYPLFILSSAPSFFLYLSPLYTNYVLARSLTTGSLTDGWFPSPPITEVTGTYMPAGSYTGTATVTDNPTNLTGFTVEATVRRTTKAEVFLNLNPTITDPVNGEITIPQIDDATTGALPYTGNFMWDLVLIDNTGERFGPFVKGDFIVSDNISQ